MYNIKDVRPECLTYIMHKWDKQKRIRINNLLLYHVILLKGFIPTISMYYKEGCGF